MAKPLTLIGVKPKADFRTNARIILPQKSRRSIHVGELYMGF